MSQGMRAEELHQLSSEALQDIIDRCERAILAGTSNHRDVLILVDCERELQYRKERREAMMLERASAVSPLLANSYMPANHTGQFLRADDEADDEAVDAYNSDVYDSDAYDSDAYDSDAYDSDAYDSDETNAAAASGYEEAREEHDEDPDDILISRDS